MPLPIVNSSTRNIKIPKNAVNIEPKYDASLVFTADYYNPVKYKKLGLVTGSATQGISISKTFFSGLKAIIGSRVTSVEESFIKVLGFAIEHMVSNANSLFPNWKKIVGLNVSMTSLNPESISIVTTGTAIGLKERKGGKSRGKSRRKFNKTRKM